MPALILVDVSNQAYKASAAFPHLRSDSGVFTGGIYGFITALCKVIREVDGARVILCEDAKPYIRQYEASGYKGDRGGLSEELFDCAEITKRQIRSFGDAMSIPSWRLPGYESDDLIAYAALTYGSKFDSVVAMSNDSDLCQLFALPHFSLHRGKKGRYGREDFQKEYGDISTDDLLTLLAMTGTHNAVRGVKGVGLITAKKILSSPSSWRAFREKHGELIDRNLELIRLPHPQFQPTPELVLPTHHYRDRALLSYCSPYSITVTQAMQNDLEKLNREIAETESGAPRVAPRNKRHQLLAG